MFSSADADRLLTALDETISSHQGRAWITGCVQHILQPDDPFPTGPTVGDIWSTIRD